MILVFSTSHDSATTEVMRCIERIDGPRVVRVNDKECVASDLRISGGHFSLVIDDVNVTSENVESVWYRKGNFWFEGLTQSVVVPGHEALSVDLTRKSEAEGARVKDYFHYLLSKRSRCLGNSRIGQINKLIALHAAREIGIVVPDYYVDSTASTVVARLQTGKQLITKAMSNGVYLWDERESRKAYFSYTEAVDCNDLDEQEKIPLSFTQDMVEKAFEVRAFYMDGEFYSSAILSQADEKTSLDYRKYNYKKPNRNVPYELPLHEQCKLRQLMLRLDLNTGSIDLMVDHHGVHYFLEVNPSGQYEAISERCGFDISMRIAEWLIGQTMS